MNLVATIIGGLFLWFFIGYAVAMFTAYLDGDDDFLCGYNEDRRKHQFTVIVLLGPLAAVVATVVSIFFGVIAVGDVAVTHIGHAWRALVTKPLESIFQYGKARRRIRGRA